MDAVLYWNDVAMEVHRRDFAIGNAVQVGGPTRVSRAFAIVHAAMYNAWVAVDPATRAAPPFYAPAGAPPLAPATATVPHAAVAGAAIATLKQLWSAQTDYIDEQAGKFYDALITAGTAPGDIYPSSNYGEVLGLALFNLRRTDGSLRPDDNAYIPAPMHHRADPMNPGQDRLSTHWGLLDPFVIPGTLAGGRVDHTLYLGPPPPPGPRYDDAVVDVKDLGHAAELPGNRTPAQTVVGTFWGYDGPRELGVPPRLYNQVVRAYMASQPALSSAENAKLLAMVHCGMGDAAIVAWGAKYDYDLWRPVIGIRQHDAGFGTHHGSGSGPTSDASDPGWLPLGAPQTNSPGVFYRTPDFPAYPSGHATFGAVSMRTVACFYAQKTGTPIGQVMKQEFSFISDEYNGKNVDPRGDVRTVHNRTLTLGHSIVENAVSRVYLGVHWRFDGLGTKAPAGLEGEPLPTDPADAHDLGDAVEARIGGVPAGLRIADMICASFPNMAIDPGPAPKC